MADVASECAAGQVRLTDWRQGWIERIASIYRLNEARLAHYDPVIKRQTPAFDVAQGALKEALDGLFAEAARELAGLPDQARQGRALRSLLNHREGLSVFVDRPQVPLDNNRAERFLRGPPYLGYKTLVGAQMRYAVHDRDGWPLAMLGFSTAAWKLAPRDNFIGWTRQKREKNLPFVVDNPRFLILPWINIPNLGSHILALIRRRLPDDWTERYNTTPVLIETFVETPRYTGAVYRASGWTRVGTTQGRGRYDRDRQSDKPKKDVWLRPLRRDWKRTLNR